MVTKNINRTDFINALVKHSEALANYQYAGFVKEFFKDESEWAGQLNRAVKQILTTVELEQRLAIAKTQNIDLKAQNASLRRRIELLEELGGISAKLIKNLQADVDAYALSLKTVPVIPVLIESGVSIESSRE